MKTSITDYQKYRLVENHWGLSVITYFIALITFWIVQVAFSLGLNVPQEIDHFSVLLFQSEISIIEKQISVLSLIWLMMMLVRILFIASPLHGGPLSLLSGNRFQSLDGNRMTITRVSFYVFLEFLPLNLLLVGIFLCGGKINPEYVLILNPWNYFNMFVMFVWFSWIPFTKGTISPALMVTRYSGLELAFTNRKIEKITKQYEEPRRKKLRRYIFPIYWTTASIAGSIIIAALIFVAFQNLRDPPLDLAYVQTFHPEPTLDWSDENGFYALEGFSAPPEIKNIHAYGRYLVAQKFKEIQEYKIKTNQKIPLAYPVPDIAKPQGFIPYNYDQSFVFDDDEIQKTTRISCLSKKERSPEETKPCIDKKAVNRFIRKTPILWKRMESIATYEKFINPPIDISVFSKGSEWMTFSFIKAAQILEMAAAGNKKQALREWQKYTNLNRKLVSMRLGMVDKAIYMISYGVFLHTLEDFLLLYPALVAKHADVIEATILPGDAVSLYRADTMMVDDWSAVETTLLQNSKAGLLPPTSGFRHKLLECAQRQKHYFVISSLGRFDGKTFRGLCESLFPKNAFSGKTLLMSGNVISNTVWSLLLGGNLKGTELVSNMYVKDAQSRMLVLAARMLKEKVSNKEAAVWIEKLPSHLHDPFSGKPFVWDAEQKQISFIDDTGKRRYYTVPLIIR